MLYPLFRNLLFCFPPEDVHYLSMYLLKSGCKIGPLRSVLKNSYTHHSPTLPSVHFGLNCRNPVGLGAGFDKNAAYLEALGTLGFGFVEIGTVTPKPQSGNPKPRLFRLPADKALINRMGFNNEGVIAVKKRLAAWKEKPTYPEMIIGGNIGKNKVTDNEDAWKDYESCFDELFDYADYFVVNVSSPNTPGLRALQEKDSLRKILSQLQHINQGKAKPKPLLLKIAPDLSKSQLDDIIDLSAEVKLSGLVATNTTISRDAVSDRSKAKSAAAGAGGLSGKPLKEKSTEILQYLIEQTDKKLPIISSGGIFTGEDAKEKLLAGASLVQVWTGFVYEGPTIVKNICRTIG